MHTDFSAIRFSKELIEDAIQRRASDIHIEPQARDWRIRLRIDGLLFPSHKLSPQNARQLINHLKVLAHLDIAETRLAQDGHFSHVAQSHTQKECRIASCPTIYGEKLVIRLLENSQELIGLEQLGFTELNSQIFHQSLKQTQGLILVTGPTGSGKTLTLYHALALLNDTTRNIISIEDPVEIKLPGITQVSINRKIGFDFARALRSFLRQDPDIIMLGEIRDNETAEMVIKAAQTGHLVLSTLHTDSALSSINRLANLGISHYNIADSLKLVIAQRLIRKICTACLTKVCADCQDGFQGRVGVYEMLSINPEIAIAITNKATNEEIYTLAQQNGFIKLAEAAQLLLNNNITTLAEIQRVIPEA